VEGRAGCTTHRNVLIFSIDTSKCSTIAEPSRLVKRYESAHIGDTGFDIVNSTWYESPLADDVARPVTFLWHGLRGVVVYGRK
jgi:hypothetical protein